MPAQFATTTVSMFGIAPAIDSLRCSSSCAVPREPGPVVTLPRPIDAAMATLGLAVVLSGLICDRVGVADLPSINTPVLSSMATGVPIHARGGRGADLVTMTPAVLCDVRRSPPSVPRRCAGRGGVETTESRF